MYSLEEKLNFYNQFSDFEKPVVRAFAVAGSFNNASDIKAILKDSAKYSSSQISKIMVSSLNAGVIELNVDSYSRYYEKYKVSIPFMTYVYSNLNQHEKSEAKKTERSYRPFFLTNEIEVREVKDFLIALLYENTISNAIKDKLSDNIWMIKQMNLMNYPIYINHFNKLDSDIINLIYSSKISDTVFDLYPLKSLEGLRSQLELLLTPEKTQLLPDLMVNIKLFEGDFDFAFNFINKKDVAAYNAIHHLMQGDLETSLKLFDEELKRLRKEHKGIHYLPSVYQNYFYTALLLSIDPVKTAARAQKILNNYNQLQSNNLNYLFKAVMYNILNKKKEKEDMADELFAYIKSSSNFYTLALIGAAYLAELTPPISIKRHIINVVQRSFLAGNYLMAYEVAYVVNEWFNDSETEKCYAQFDSKMSYKPVASLINKVEHWEKSLNLIFNALGGANKKANAGIAVEDKYRIVYTFDPNNFDIKPILQTRNAKGLWSAGRNVAMKTFYEGKANGMTDKDLRVSKCINYYKGGYYESDWYEFTKQVVVELIGHPYLFLANTKDVPVEFVAAKPEVKVSKKKKGYTLESDIKAHDSSIFLKKETNTRYRVYNLNKNVSELITILTTEQVTVPEEGKDKLVQLLGEISKHVTVQSDLLTTATNSNLTVKNVEPDNRIRVQLLPFGDGLKAELFVKPFSEIPPYSKPGAGGKVLITNVNGEQWQVKRDFGKEIEFSNAVLNDIQMLESVDMSDNLISFDDPMDSLHLLDVLASHKDKCVIEWPEGERFKIRSMTGFSDLKMRIKSKTNWFELEGELRVDEDTVISLQQLMSLMKKGHDRFIELKEGEFIALSQDLKKRLEELYSFSTNEKNGLQLNKFASIAMGDLFDEVGDLKSDKAWKSFRKRITSPTSLEVAIPSSLHADLRPYQEDGFRWMARLAELEGGACLADDMGLGKTIQTLAVLLQRASEGAALVVCPVSVISNWINEAQRFAPSLNVKMLGNGVREQTIKELSSGDVLVTSYGLLQSEEKMFIEKEFATIVLDEAHIIKNNATKTSKAIMQLQGKFRLALTGTPLQNHLGEIWNLFNFINPGLLGNLNHFTDTFIKPDNDYSRKLLRKLIKPFILRRTKSAVLDELPPKTEIVKKVQLSDTEMAFYEALRRQALLNLESGEGNQGTKHLRALAEITKLRQASCNPLLVDPDIDIKSSKLAVFLEIVDELRENKHRALVFSQFVSHLSIVRKALDEKKIHYQYLDGSSPLPERERSVEKFQKGEGDLFLISLKAGGLGLNLTAADFVIHLDPWWNPAIEDQASDRAHRIGQKRPVTIYRLVAENTIEEKIIQLHNTKRNLAESLLEGSDQSAKMSLNELVDLIKENG